MSVVREVDAMVLAGKHGYTEGMLCDLVYCLSGLSPEHQEKAWSIITTWAAGALDAKKAIVREHIRLTTQPFDAQDSTRELERWVDQMKSDRMLLFSTDFPHWHFEGTDALPVPASSPLARRMLFDNPLETYPRLRETLKIAEVAA